MTKRSRRPRKKSINLAPLELTITEVSRSGAGIGRDGEGRAVFVPFTAPGDRVKVQLHKVKQRYAEAELLELVTASKERVEPRCPVFTQCGGCQWQHLPYALQWKTKSKGVVEALRRAGINKPPAWDEFPAQQIWEYRNRIQLRAKGSQLGYYSGKSHRLIPIDYCNIAHPKINAMIPQVRNENRADTEISKIELQLTTQETVEQIVNNQNATAGFRQVNDEQNVKLQCWIKNSIQPVDGILDLYGGSGNLSLPLMSMASEIHCVDLNIADKGVSNTHQHVHFHNTMVVPWLERRLEKISNTKAERESCKNWLAIIDPPRSGLEKEGYTVIKILEKLEVSTVILVGCKTDPWIRDLASFLDRRWLLEKIALFDFFPQTFHVEAVAKLSRTKMD